MNGFNKALKKVFPINFLKKAYRLFKKTRVAIVDPLLFGEYPLSEKDFLFYRKGYPFKENNVDISGLQDARVRDYMKQWYNWTQEEFILELKQPVVIEPDNGWAIAPGRKLVYYSLGISRTWFLSKPRFFKYIFRKKVKQVDSMVSFRDTGEENYFHFFNDVLSKLYFLQSHNVDLTGKQFVISRKLYDKPWFQWYLKQAGEVNWLVQDDEYIETRSVIFCKPLTHRKDLFDKIFAQVIKTSTVNKKIFVTRNRKRLRHIGNEQEVIEVLRGHGFDAVDPDHLSPEQQREIFSGASVIVGVHGAALTNVLFREGDCRVLEIFPPPEEGYLPFHYIMIAGLKGFRYDAMIGEGTKLDSSGSFIVNVQQLNAAVVKML